MANRAVPVIIQLVIFYLVISWLARLVRRNRQRAPTGKPVSEPRPGAAPSSSTPPAPVEPSPQGGAVRREELTFNGVLWQVTFRPHRDLAPGARSLRRDVYVEEPPRCPKCRLGVVETQSWLGYLWSCPACGRRQRSSKSSRAVAEALARSLH